MTSLVGTLNTNVVGTKKTKTSYYYSDDIGHYHYGPMHPMKPHRIRMTHNLIINYGLYKKLEINVSIYLTQETEPSDDEGDDQVP